MISDDYRVYRWQDPHTELVATLSGRRKFSSWYWHPQCGRAPTKPSLKLFSRPPPHFFSIFPRLLLFFKHSSNNLNCSTLREQKQAPGSTDVFGCLSGTHLTLHQDLSGTEKSSQWPQAPVCRELLGFSRLRRNVWPCVPAKLQKLADLI